MGDFHVKQTQQLPPHLNPEGETQFDSALEIPGTTSSQAVSSQKGLFKMQLLFGMS